MQQVLYSAKFIIEYLDNSYGICIEDTIALAENCLELDTIRKHCVDALPVIEDSNHGVYFHLSKLTAQAFQDVGEASGGRSIDARVQQHMRKSRRAEQGSLHYMAYEHCLASAQKDHHFV